METKNILSMSEDWDQFIFSRTSHIQSFVVVHDKEYQEEKKKSDKLYKELENRLSPELWDLVNEFLEMEAACDSRNVRLLYKQGLKDGTEFNKELGGTQI